MFNLGDYVVCPGHGVGQILEIENREIGTETKSYYIIKIITNGMKIMIPAESDMNAAGAIRTLVADSEIEEVFNLLKNHDVKIDTSTWNRRQREYLLKLKSGSLVEIAQVLRELFLLKISKKLSFGEKKMFDQCKELMIKEISISQGMAEKDVSGQIDSCFS